MRFVYPAFVFVCLCIGVGVSAGLAGQSIGVPDLVFVVLAWSAGVVAWWMARSTPLVVMCAPVGLYGIYNLVRGPLLVFANREPHLATIPFFVAFTVAHALLVVTLVGLPWRREWRLAVVWVLLGLGIAGGAIPESPQLRTWWFAARGSEGMPGLRAEPELEVEPVFARHSIHEAVSVIADQTQPDSFVLLQRAGLVSRLEGLTGGAHTLLDLRDRTERGQWEQGLYTLVFHPDFPATPYAFVSYVHTDRETRVSRFRYDADADRFDADSELVVLRVPQRRTRHNGGALAFGPDGMLYASFGDDGRTYRPNATQSVRKGLWSSIVRIDVDCEDGPYCVPPDNPFVHVPGAHGELFAIGVRNVFRISFDRTGRLWAADAGSRRWEEIDIVVPGANLGWPWVEGPEWSRQPQRVPFGTWTTPQVSYSHDGLRRCIIGGVVYQGTKHADLNDHFVFADLGSGEVFAVDTNAPEHVRLLAHLGAEALPTNVSQAGEDLFVTTLEGTVYRLTEAAPASNAWLAAHDGPSLFQTLCAYCHGKNGSPETAGRYATNKVPPSFRDRDWQDGVTDAHIAGVIRRGGAANGLSPEMPSWKDVLSDAEVDELVAVVRAFAGSE